MDRRSLLHAAAGVLTVTGFSGCVSESPGKSTTKTQSSPTTTSEQDSPGGSTTEPRSSPVTTSEKSGHTRGWPTFGANAAHTGFAPNETGPQAGQIAWSAIGDAPTVLCSPTVKDGSVYVGSAANMIHAFDAATGETRWEYPTSSYVEVAPTVTDDTVYSADADGVIYALTTDGEKKWTLETEHNLHTKAVALADGTLFVGTAGTMPAVVSGDTDKSRASLVLALDAETGEQKWQFKASDWFTGPTVGGNHVYAGNNNSTLYALDRSTGEEVWSWQATGGSFLAPPTYANETVFAGIHGGGELVAFDAKTGSIRWRSNLNAGNVKSSPAVDGERVYIGAARIRAVAAVGRAATGRTETTNENTPTSTPESGTTGIFSAHSISDGKSVWQYKTDHDFRSSPAVLTDTVYIGGGNGMVAVKRQTGKERWSVQFDDYVYSSPAVANERAYIGSADGHLYCIAGME